MRLNTIEFIAFTEKKIILYKQNCKIKFKKTKIKPVSVHHDSHIDVNYETCSQIHQVHEIFCMSLFVS
jgi:uncharacterized protein with PIN domain